MYFKTAMTCTLHTGDAFVVKTMSYDLKLKCSMFFFKIKEYYNPKKAIMTATTHNLAKLNINILLVSI